MSFSFLQSFFRSGLTAESVKKTTEGTPWEEKVVKCGWGIVFYFLSDRFSSCHS